MVKTQNRFERIMGVDSGWEQGKLEARKMSVKRADSHLSGARGVGCWMNARFVNR